MAINIYSMAAISLSCITLNTMLSLDELLLTLSCPAFMNSSLLEVNETFTDKEPEKSNRIRREVKFIISTR